MTLWMFIRIAITYNRGSKPIFFRTPKIQIFLDCTFNYKFFHITIFLKYLNK
jgi:hypothetical protein